MIWNASALKDYRITATDGVIGTLLDLLYRNSDWLTRRRFVLPMQAVGVPDPEARQLPVNLTERQIEQSPDLETIAPRSSGADQEAGDLDDFPHGRDHFIWGGHTGKPAISTEGQTRSLWAMIGDAVEASDGNVGHAEVFLIDTDTWKVSDLVVHTSSWWVGEKRPLSPLSVDWTDGERRILHLDTTRQGRKDSPPYASA